MLCYLLDADHDYAAMVKMLQNQNLLNGGQRRQNSPKEDLTPVINDLPGLLKGVIVGKHRFNLWEFTLPD